MSWTYSGDPAVDTKDTVRYLVGDTDGTDQQVTDEEILWAISSEGNLYYAAARVASGIAAHYGRQVTKWVGDMKLMADRRQKSYRDIAMQLRQRGLANLYPSVGGTSIAAKIAEEQLPDRVTPAFVRGQFDYPGLDEPGGQAGAMQTT